MKKLINLLGLLLLLVNCGGNRSIKHKMEKDLIEHDMEIIYEACTCGMLISVNNYKSTSSYKNIHKECETLVNNIYKGTNEKDN